MTLQLLVSCVGQDVPALCKKMNIGSDAIIVNQKSEYKTEIFNHNGYLIKALSMDEKGVGLSRTTALQRATADIVLFADEDIVYEDGYEQMVLDEFEKYPDADMILFNVNVCEERRTYWNESAHRVHRWNCGRYPAYSIAARRKKLHELGITYHLWFGGGGIFSNGEDSLFLNESLKKGMKLMAVPTCIGEEKPRENGQLSTWFNGYDEKYFYDRGVLYHYLYGSLAPIMTFRFLMKNKNTMCKTIPVKRAKMLMRMGAKMLVPFDEV
ncbi:MAG: glycosyltransferase family 2 protein [Lachnospiraceae bacterium]|nr:glycosyltransferase family 2 protein [Lachnospiraceae bacterium]